MRSRPPDELDSVAWTELWHAYGSALDVPGLIRDLYSGDAERIDKALGGLHDNVLHQGTVYPATAAAVPFLAHAVAHVPCHRDGLLLLLAGAAGERERAARSDVEEEARVRVGACVPESLPFLADGDPAVRRAAVRVAYRATGAAVPAAGLLPRIEVFRDARYEWDAMRAAEAHWRITGDPSPAVASLTALAGPTPVGVAALRPRLRVWADSRRRLMATLWEWVPEHLRPDDDVLRETAMRLLGERGTGEPEAQPTGPVPSGAPAA
ncbi:hypothetical protein ACFW3D_12845 [Streptomyces sp. NPDC058864]